jgi:hypothetical protein
MTRDIFEQADLLKKLEAHGLGEFVALMLSDERQVYTKSGRLNKSGACRVLGLKVADLNKLLEQCREILAEDI